MSDDLISRQHLLNRIRYYVSHTNNGSPENYAYNIALNEIIQAPKAFDKEKVIENLQGNSHSYYPSVDHYCLSKKSRRIERCNKDCQERRD